MLHCRNRRRDARSGLRLRLLLGLGAILSRDTSVPLPRHKRHRRVPGCGQNLATPMRGGGEEEQSNSPFSLFSAILSPRPPHNVHIDAACVARNTVPSTPSATRRNPQGGCDCFKDTPKPNAALPLRDFLCSLPRFAEIPGAERGQMWACQWHTAAVNGCGRPGWVWWMDYIHKIPPPPAVLPGWKGLCFSFPDSLTSLFAFLRT